MAAAFRGGAMASLIRSVQSSAKDISTKYLNPPKTIDFAILVPPTERLYATVLRQAGLIEKLRDEHRVGPSVAK